MPYWRTRDLLLQSTWKTWVRKRAVSNLLSWISVCDSCSLKWSLNCSKSSQTNAVRLDRATYLASHSGGQRCCAQQQPKSGMPDSLVMCDTAKTWANSGCQHWPNSCPCAANGSWLPAQTKSGSHIWTGFNSWSVLTVTYADVQPQSASYNSPLLANM